ncbi:hypothetical protein [Planomonospora venezuelensis]|uniref:Integral membrane protein n=1 Tax=Planomonospora venezuelensis TaxID=1999 RepID=A0A841DDP4_PLAVE|nr:hypothetical protein [Planomonospora venezuelensis]MBB5966903.1 hypothetical protein [Planomonospora venezuelensis]GIN02404.1 hypothetical protein Pve01_40620 [Planomonospora venezuelensis]
MNEHVNGSGGAVPASGAPSAGAAAVGAGPGRVLVAVYGIFALAAGARAAVQIARQFDEAPLAYLLSAFAALVYLVLAVALARENRVLATVACGIELAGVLIVGTFSLVDPEAFPKATVWSGFGSGYVYIPLVLPLLGLFWLSRRR